jgi:small subunit ribosomal protein S16
MKKLGRRHRPFYRICAMDSRTPRDGRVLEELGTYDPMVPETDARAILVKDRIQYWLSVGASPSEKVAALIKKYGAEGTHLEQQQQALDRLAQARRRPEPPADLPKPVPVEKKEEPAEQPTAEAPAEVPAAEEPQAEEKAEGGEE